MRIGMLLIGGVYPPDIRVEKEAKVLTEAGHEVFLLTSNKDRRPAEEDVPPLRVSRYEARPAAWRAKLGALGNVTSFYSPVWARDIRDFVRRHRIDALHVHDLPAVKSAVKAGRAEGIPVVFDMHENYPYAVKHWVRTGLAARLQTPRRYEGYERWAVENADRVVVVIEEMAERLAGELGADRGKLTVFGNVDDYEGEPTWRGPGEPFVIAYAGGFAEHRGIDVLIRAFEIVRHADPGARLVLMGAGWGREELEALAARLGVSDGVEFTGWVGLDEMRERLSQASVGAVPHISSPQTEATIPHKLFQYMAMGLPVVVSSCRPLKRILEESGAGRVALAGDHADLATKLLELRDADAASQASGNGVRATRDRFNLRVEGRRLVELYRGLETRDSS